MNHTQLYSTRTGTAEDRTFNSEIHNFTILIERTVRGFIDTWSNRTVQLHPLASNCLIASVLYVISSSIRFRLGLINCSIVNLEIKLPAGTTSTTTGSGTVFLVRTKRRNVCSTA